MQHMSQNLTECNEEELTANEDELTKLFHENGFPLKSSYIVSEEPVDNFFERFFPQKLVDYVPLVVRAGLLYRRILKNEIFGFKWALWCANHTVHRSLWGGSSLWDYSMTKTLMHPFRKTEKVIPEGDLLNRSIEHGRYYFEHELWQIRSPIIQGQHFSENLGAELGLDKCIDCLIYSGSALRRYVLMRRFLVTLSELMNKMIYEEAILGLAFTEVCMLNLLQSIIIRDQAPISRPSRYLEDLDRISILPLNLRDEFTIHLDDIILRYSLFFWTQRRFGWDAMKGVDG